MLDFSPAVLLHLKKKSPVKLANGASFNGEGLDEAHARLPL